MANLENPLQQILETSPTFDTPRNFDSNGTKKISRPISLPQKNPAKVITAIFYDKPYDAKILMMVVAGFIENQTSPHTRQEYIYSITEFFHFVSNHYIKLERPQDLTREHVIGFARYLKEKKLANKTILKKMSGISSMCRHLAEAGLVDKDITYGVKRPKTINTKETAAFSDKEVKRLFEKLNQKSYAYHQYRALLAIGFYTGLRSSEIRNLKIKNFGEVDGHRVINTVIKGEKPHEIILNPFVVRCLKEHIAKLNEMGFRMDGEHYLFPTLKPKVNKPYTREGLRKILKKAMDQAGISPNDFRRYSPHTMRATFASHLLHTVEAPLEEVQRLMGHASPTTTKMYDKREPIRDKSPVYKMGY